MNLLLPAQKFKDVFKIWGCFCACPKLKLKMIVRGKAADRWPVEAVRRGISFNDRTLSLMSERSEQKESLWYAECIMQFFKQ